MLTNLSRGRQPGKNLEYVISGANARSIGHLANWIGRAGGMTPELKSDTDIDQKRDISFISIGFKNYKTEDILEDPANNFLKFEEKGSRCIVSVAYPKICIAPGTEPGYDFGIIVKIRSTACPGRSWICCAGFAEWGTSGAVWYLTRNWGKIHSQVKGAPFGFITKTRKGVDEATEVIQGLVLNEKTGKIEKC